MKMEAGWAVQRRPAGGGGLKMVVGVVEYALVKVTQSEMNRQYARGRGLEFFEMPSGYPQMWCERGVDWVQVYPRPAVDVEVVSEVGVGDVS